MLDHHGLQGQRVLVVEDDYFLAMDAAAIITTAGGEVLGPFPDEGAALREIANSNPTLGVLDIDLGSGPNFLAARALMRRKVPLIFFTGYGADTLPPEFAGVTRCEKPLQPWRLVQSLVDAAKGRSHE